MTLRFESFAQAELTFRLSDVRRVQEWLCLRGRRVEVDGKSGPATAGALEDFRRSTFISEDSPGDMVAAMLREPMSAALAGKARGEPSFAESIVAAAQAHLAARPREIGANAGPWVRLYMRGAEGLPWCAGFVTTILRQAAEAIETVSPLAWETSCDVIGKIAEKSGRLAAAPAVGGLFLLRADPLSGRRWGHVGIVTSIEGATIRTIEGNTNPDGGREGYEVEARTRGIAGKDFVTIAA